MAPQGVEPRREVSAEGLGGAGQGNTEMVAQAVAGVNGGALPHVEAARLLALGFKLCELKPMRKAPVGDGWQLNPIAAIRPSAGGYGVLLAANGLGSIDPDRVDRAQEGLRRCGFDLETLMAAGVRTTSTRPGSGGRSTFRVPPGLGRVVFRSKTFGTLLELRATQPNLQDCLPGTVYLGKHGDGPYTQAYANGRTLDEAPDLADALPEFFAWWDRCYRDLAFRREQEALFAGPDDAVLSVSGTVNGKVTLAHTSGRRADFNAAHDVVEILERHGYKTEDGERWAPSTATGAPCVRQIPGKDALWQSDHGSDPLLGTFDAWTAHVTLDHDGNTAAAEAAFDAMRHTEQAGDFDAIPKAAPPDAPPVLRRPIALNWSALPEDPPEPAFVIPGWLPLNVVTLVAAHGGTGKSYVSLYVALCLATGRHPFDEGAEVPRVRVVLYSAEDGMAAMMWRLRRYMRLLEIEPADVDGRLVVLDATEADNVLFIGDEKKPEGRTTQTFEWLRQQVQAAGATVLIFDNASDALDANENDRAKVRQFMGALKRLTPAVLLLAHVDAISSMADPGQAKGYSGSTAWHNSARSRWFMARRPDTDDVLLSLPKVNYARAGSEVTLRWDDDLKLFRVVSARVGRAKAADSRSVLLGLFRQVIDAGLTVSPSKTASTSLFNQVRDLVGFPPGLDTKRVDQEVRAWVLSGLAAVETFDTPDRKKRERLVLTAAGRAALAESGAEAAGLV